ncbi:MAG: hypothetical protein HZA78_07890 [Candidatus Schekmanbacteria bacterium]|nr:hypothetical protein [Candidatus Schekmanbacteria bacterium]
MKVKKLGGVCLVTFFLLLLSLNAGAATIFSDDFNDGNAAGWAFYGPNSGYWSVNNGTLHHNSPGGYNSYSEFALIDGITTPNRFTLEADINVLGSKYGNDWGHVGLIWGVNDFNYPFQSFNTSYLRTHQDRVTNWSQVNGNWAYGNERFLNVTGGATNGVTYHLKVDVDYTTRLMTVGLNSDSITFSDSTFDLLNQNSGGGIGLISWNDHISYDNVRLTVVPEPATILLLVPGFLGMIGYKKGR